MFDVCRVRTRYTILRRRYTLHATDPLTVPNLHDVLIHVTKYYVVGGNEKMLASAPGSVRRGGPNLCLVARPLCTVRSAVPPVARVILWPAPSRRRGSRTHTPDRRNGPKSSLLYATRVHATRSALGPGRGTRPAAGLYRAARHCIWDNRINLKQHDDIIMPGGDT